MRKNNESAARDFSKKTLKALNAQGVFVIGAFNAPGRDVQGNMSFACSETVYELDNNGCGMVRSHKEVHELSGGAVMSAVEFSTSEYEYNHGAKPRGRGSWAFAFDCNEKPEALFWTPGSTTYGEALKLARAEAKRRGASMVTVVP